jgi:hypothetical protein
VTARHGIRRAGGIVIQFCRRAGGSSVPRLLTRSCSSRDTRAIGARRAENEPRIVVRGHLP